MYHVHVYSFDHIVVTMLSRRGRSRSKWPCIKGSHLVTIEEENQLFYAHLHLTKEVINSGIIITLYIKLQS